MEAPPSVPLFMISSRPNLSGARECKEPPWQFGKVAQDMKP